MLLDTCIIIAIAKAGNKEQIFNYLEDKEFIYISTVSFSEYLSFKEIDEDSISKNIFYLKEYFTIVDFDVDSAIECSKLRRKYLQDKENKENIDLRKGLVDFMLLGTAMTALHYEFREMNNSGRVSQEKIC